MTKVLEKTKNKSAKINLKSTGKVQKKDKPAKKEQKNSSAKLSEKKVKKEKRKKTSKETEISKKKEALKNKNHPVFRGRFGARFKRRKSNKKWDKWRYPRGIDINFKKDDGAIPKIGYRGSKKIRFLHPSGLKEVVVSNPKELLNVKEEHVAIRFAGKIGKRKKIEMIKQSKGKNFKILNR